MEKILVEIYIYIYTFLIWGPWNSHIPKINANLCLYLYRLILVSAVSNRTPGNCGLTKYKFISFSNIQKLKR